MRYFFDSSAYMKLFQREKGSERVKQVCQEADELGLSIICLPELIAAICRFKREKQINLARYKIMKSAIIASVEDVEILQLTNEVYIQAVILLENNVLRAMDALHIGCAIEWGAEFFVSSDKRQLKAAEKAGLKTIKV
jgi:uncharacterized protein